MCPLPVWPLSLFCPRPWSPLKRGKWDGVVLTAWFVWCGLDFDFDSLGLFMGKMGPLYSSSGILLTMLQLCPAPLSPHGTPKLRRRTVLFGSVWEDGTCLARTYCSLGKRALSGCLATDNTTDSLSWQDPEKTLSTNKRAIPATLRPRTYITQHNGVDPYGPADCGPKWATLTLPTQSGMPPGRPCNRSPMNALHYTYDTLRKNPGTSHSAAQAGRRGCQPRPMRRLVATLTLHVHHLWW